MLLTVLARVNGAIAGLLPSAEEHIKPQDSVVGQQHHDPQPQLTSSTGNQESLGTGVAVPRKDTAFSSTPPKSTMKLTHDEQKEAPKSVKSNKKKRKGKGDELSNLFGSLT